MPEPAAPALSSNERWGLAALLAILFLWTLAPLAGYDFWYYLAVGRDIAQTGHIPFSESYLGTTSILAFGRYANEAWLSYFFCYLWWAGGGPLGLVLLKSSLLTATTGLVYLSCRRLAMEPFWAGAWSTLGLWTIRGRFEMRSYLFTDLALAALVWLLVTQETNPNRRRTGLSLFLLFALWTNLHQGFIAGFVVGAAWVLLGRTPWQERWSIAGLVVAGTLCRPHALSFPAFLFDHFSNGAAIGGVVEWAAPTGDVLLYQVGLFYLVLLGLGGAGIGRIWRRKTKPPWAFAAAALFFALLALRSTRSIGELLPIVCPLAAALFPPLPPAPRPKIVAGLTLATLLFFSWHPTNLAELSRASGYPDQLVDAIPKGSGQLFNSFEYGNYLVFRRVSPFLHGITSLFPAQLITDFEDVLNPTSRRQEVLQKYAVGAALLHLPTDNDATLNLVETLAASPDWKLELWDDTGVLFVRGPRESGYTHVYPWKTPSWTDPAAAEIELFALTRRSSNAIACRFLSQLLLQRGELAQATEQANRAIQLSPYFYGAWTQLGLCYAKAGNLDGVLSASAGGLKAADGGAPAHFNRGLALLEQSKRENGVSSTWHRWGAWYHARRALWLDPGFAPARQLLQNI